MNPRAVLVATGLAAAFGAGWATGRSGVDRESSGRDNRASVVRIQVSDTIAPGRRFATTMHRDSGSAAAARSALKRAQGLPPGSVRDQALAAAVNELVREDIAAAFDYIERLGQPLGTRLLASAAQALAEEDPDLAALCASALPASSLRLSTVAFVAAAFAEKDPDGALAWLRSLPEGSERRAGFQQMIGKVSTTHPLLAIEVAEQLPRGDLRTDAVRRVVAEWIQREPEAALAWLRAMPAGEPRERVILAASGRLAESDPVAAWRLAKELKGGSKSVAIGQIARMWAAQNTPDALAWAGQLEGRERADFLTGVVSGLAQSAPRVAAGYLGELPDDLRVPAAQTVAAQWAALEPAGAAAWAAGLTDGALRERVLNQVAVQWADIDGESAGRWLTSLPAGTARDAALQACARQLSHEVPAKAVALAASIHDPAQREPVLGELVRRWLTSDRRSAETWLLASTLPRELQRQLIDEAAHAEL